MDVKNSLKKDGKITITIKMDFSKSDFSNHDIKESEYRLDGWVNMFWDDVDGYIEEELETIRQK